MTVETRHVNENPELLAEADRIRGELWEMLRGKDLNEVLNILITQVCTTVAAHNHTVRHLAAITTHHEEHARLLAGLVMRTQPAGRS